MYMMSDTESSCHGVETPCLKVHESTEDGRAQTVRNNSSSPDRSERERVLKEVGITSTTFIGPAFPPVAVRSDIEDTLSEFYKELEEIDAPSAADYNPGRQDAGCVQSPETSASTDVTDGITEENLQFTQTDRYQKGRLQKPPPWPHWYQNEPYSLQRLRPGMDLTPGRAPTDQNQWRYPQTVNRPRPLNPRFHRPPFHRPPPLTAFPNPQNPPERTAHNRVGSWTRIHYQEEPHFPTFRRVPPPNVGSHPSQVLYEDPLQHSDRHKPRYNYDENSGNINVGWYRDREEEWCPLSEDYDRRQRYDSKNYPGEHRCQPADNNSAFHSSLVLILMRGLPGSGKSTLARELLSTGPSGLILSTDDYFAHGHAYCFDPDHLGAAHEWNQSRAKNAMHDGRSPIIIDNTNIQAWEMKPYVRMALERGYKVEFCEPDTLWKFDPYELEKRNKHGVPQEKIAQMMDRFSFPISIDIVMSSQEPLHVNQRRRPEQPEMMRKDFH